MAMSPVLRVDGVAMDGKGGRCGPVGVEGCNEVWGPKPQSWSWVQGENSAL
jgi:hypothetical protein